MKNIEEKSKEELEKENQKLKQVLENDARYHAIWGQIWSSIICGSVALIFTIFVMFAVIGSSAVINEGHLSDFWIGAIKVFFNLGSKAVILFIAWHYVLTTYYRFQPEIGDAIEQLNEKFKRGIAAFNTPS